MSIVLQNNANFRGNSEHQMNQSYGTPYLFSKFPYFAPGAPKQDVHHSRLPSMLESEGNALQRGSEENLPFVNLKKNLFETALCN